MRKFVLFALLLTAFFIWLNRNDNSQPSASNSSVHGQAQSVSEHDWAKRSIDRARSVTEQARQNRIESQQP